jgi:hypothetical protein
MKYPNRIIQKGEADKSIVKAIQNKLNDVGCGPIDVDGDYGNQAFAAVKLFQSTRKDANGNPLIIDGKIGAITWEILFGNDNVSSQQNASSIFLRELIIAATDEVGTMEVPLGSNKGPRVKQYLNSVGLDEGYYWCAAFVYFCAEKASLKIGKTNPLVKTAGCLDHWNRTTANKIAAKDAKENVSLVKPGSIFIIDLGKGMGHTGIVTSREGGFINIIEGNSNPEGGSNGIGVFQLQRKIANIQKGFILY